MAQHFFGNPAATFQSTPKPDHHHSAVTLKGPGEGQSMDRDTTGNIGTLSFVTLDDSHEQPSEDSGISVSNNRSPRDHPGDDSICSYPLNSRIDVIGKKAQDLIERINLSRAMDQKIMGNLEDKLMKKVTDVCQQVKQQMFVCYEENSRGMEAQLQELSELLERSSQLSTELQGASHTLAAINKGLQQNSEQ